MNWTHRLLRHKNGDLEIVEMIYEDDGKYLGWTQATVYAHKDSGEYPDLMDALQEQIAWFALALNEPIVDEW